MSTLRTAIFIVWAVFWIYWLLAASTNKERSRQGSRIRLIRPTSALIILGAFFVIRNVKGTGSLIVHSPVLEVVGTIVFLSGLAFAVWARLHLGRNWGMPMTERAEPELVTSGPYRLVRHPIYTGILVGVLGTALAVNLYYLIPLGILTAYFVFSATVEERMLTASFPDAYPRYKARTKMLIPFLL
jgi:protein-S-isoprenylcysteine O-methyltransferase Ste14